MSFSGETGASSAPVKTNPPLELESIRLSQTVNSNSGKENPI